jgi:ABC-type dipeptide/oligopeptide/nickel transport system permease component
VSYCRASGLKEPVLIRHILKNSLQTAVSAFFLAVPGLLAGTVVVENVFAWPGIGRICVVASSVRIYPLFRLMATLINLTLISVAISEQSGRIFYGSNRTKCAQLLAVHGRTLRGIIRVWRPL